MKGLAGVAVLLLGGGLVSCLGACTSAASTPPEGAPLRIGGEDFDGTPLLSPLIRRAESAGAEDLRVLGSRLLAQGEQLGRLVDLPESPARCLVALAQPGEGVGDLDLFVYADDGDRLAADESPASAASVMLCPPYPRRVYVAARVTDGMGMVAAAVMMAPRSRATQVAAALGAWGWPHGDTGKLSAWPGLERKLRERRKALGSHWQDMRRVLLPLDSRAPTLISLPVPARRCLDVFVTPAAGVRGIDLRIFDRAGRTVARHAEAAGDHGLVVCSRRGQQVSVSIRSKHSAGLAALVAARSSLGGAAELAKRHWVNHTSAPSSLSEALDKHRSRTASLGAAVHATVSPTEAVSPQLSLSVPLALPAGCRRIDTLAAAPLGAFEVALWDEQGKRRGRSYGAEYATLHSCGPATQLQVEVSAEEGRGKIALQVRNDAQPSPLLLTHSRAAGRLLDRLEEALGPVEASELVQLRVLPLGASSRSEIELSVPAGRCAMLAAASETDRAVGLQMRLRIEDGKPGAVAGKSQHATTRSASKQPRLDSQATSRQFAWRRALGRTAVGQQVCAPPGRALALRVELRSMAGASRALWAAIIR